MHVHLEHTGEATAADAAAQAVLRRRRRRRDWNALADYYRSRKIGCVVFTVDERLTGRPQVSNDAVAEFAAENADIAIAVREHRSEARRRRRPRGAAARGGRGWSAG